MKNLLKIAVLTPLFLVSVSCEQDFLDRKPLKVTLDDIEQGGIVGQVFGIYGMLRSNEMSILPSMTMEYFRDDDSMKGSSLADGRDYEVVADEFNYTKDHWFTNSYWSKHFEMIDQHDLVIDFGGVQVSFAVHIAGSTEFTGKRAPYLRRYTGGHPGFRGNKHPLHQVAVIELKPGFDGAVSRKLRGVHLHIPDRSSD